MSLKSLISTNKIFGCHYPQKLQSVVVRNYLNYAGLPSVLHLTSFLNDNDILEREFFTDKDLDTIVLFSMGQLNNLSSQDRVSLENFLSQADNTLHFALEVESLRTTEELNKLFKKLKIVDGNGDRVQVVKDLERFRNKLVNLITKSHLKTKRSYHSRSGEEKPQFAKLAKEFGRDYWDGSRDTGYGGYSDDGRWKEVAQKIIQYYELNDKSSILDVGCGKGYLMKEIKTLLPESTVMGLDISNYAIENSAPEVRHNIIHGCASDLPFPDNSFDLIFSNMTLHNLNLPKLFQGLKEMSRVSSKHCWIGVESYESESQKWNLMRWQLTCECFFTPEEWLWIFKEANYKGDYELIYFD